MSISISVTSFYCPCSFGKKYHKQTKKQPTNQLILFMWSYISGLFCLIWSTEFVDFVIPHFCNFIVSLDIIDCHYPHLSSLNIILVIWVLFPFHSHTKKQFVDNLQRQVAILASWWTPASISLGVSVCLQKFVLFLCVLPVRNVALSSLSRFSPHLAQGSSVQPHVEAIPTPWGLLLPPPYHLFLDLFCVSHPVSWTAP